MENNNSYEAKSGSGVSKWILLFIIIIVAVLVGVYFLFQSEFVDSDVSLEDQGVSGDDNFALQSQEEFVDCGQTPSNFATDAGDDYELYFKTYPDVKKSLGCISNNFKECNPAIIKYLGEYVDNIFIVNRTEGDNCVVQYESGDKGVECEYTLEQVKMFYEVSEENGQFWATAYGISFGMGFEIMRYSSGETFEQEVTNKYTGQIEKVPCKFYGSSNEVTEEIAKEDSDKVIEEGAAEEDLEVSIEGKDFEYSTDTKCGSENRIWVSTKSTGTTSINEEDWEVSRIDGKDIIPKFKKVAVFTFEHYSEGEHIIELGWEGNVKIKIVSCGEPEEYHSETISGNGKIFNIDIEECGEIDPEKAYKSKYIYFLMSNLGSENITKDDYEIFEIDGKKFSLYLDIDVDESKIISWSGETTNSHEFKVQLKGGEMVEFTYECQR